MVSSNTWNEGNTFSRPDKITQVCGSPQHVLSTVISKQYSPSLSAYLALLLSIFRTGNSFPVSQSMAFTLIPLSFNFSCLYML